jgi:hypothetical protein
LKLHCPIPISEKKIRTGYSTERGEGREGKGREGKGREGKGDEDEVRTRRGSTL